MIKSGIYAILNSITDKIYVGSAVNIQYRWKNHRIALRYNKHTNRYLQAAYNKELGQGFVYTVLEYVEDKTKLIEKEQYYIDLTKSFDRTIGYNLSPTAGSCLGIIHSEETRVKLSSIRKGRARTDAEKAAIKEGWKKRKEAGPVSEETKQRLSESHRGKKHTEEFKLAAAERMKGNQFNKGRTQTEEHKIAISNSKKGHVTSEETRIKIAESNKGQKRSAEARARMSEAAKMRHKRDTKDKMWEW